MNILTSLFAALTVAVAAYSIPAQAADVPAGDYTLDKSHASLLFRVNHMGFSNYTARFIDFDAALKFDPAKPENSSVTATVDPSSIETDYPNPEKVDFNKELQNDKWLNVAAFPKITFQSTRVEVTGANTARIHGNLSLHGISKPLVLETTFNGGYAGSPMDPNARIGFSARGSLKRSDFGVSYGIPAPGTTMGVSDAVEIIIEAEFTGPKMAAAVPAAAPIVEKPVEQPKAAEPEKVTDF